MKPSYKKKSERQRERKREREREREKERERGKEREGGRLWGWRWRRSTVSCCICFFLFPAANVEHSSRPSSFKIESILEQQNSKKKAERERKRERERETKRKTISNKIGKSIEQKPTTEELFSQKQTNKQHQQNNVSASFLLSSSLEERSLFEKRQLSFITLSLPSL